MQKCIIGSQVQIKMSSLVEQGVGSCKCLECVGDSKEEISAAGLPSSSEEPMQMPKGSSVYYVPVAKRLV